MRRADATPVAWRRRRLGVLATAVMLLSLVQAAAAAVSCPASTAYKHPNDGVESVYKSELPDPGSGRGWVNFAKGLSRTAAPNDLDVLKLQQLMEEGHAPCCSGELFEYLRSWGTGVAVVGVIGIVLALTMPVVGMIFGCCRCSGHCGGQMVHEKESTNERRCLYLLMVFTLLCSLAGIIMLYKSSSTLSTTTTTVDGSFNVFLDDIGEFKDHVFAQGSNLIDNFDVPRRAIFRTLDRVNDTLGADLQQLFRPDVDALVPMVRQLATDAERVNASLAEAEGIEASLEASRQALGVAVADLNADLDDAADDCRALAAGGSAPGLDCEADIAAHRLNVTANYTGGAVPSVRDLADDAEQLLAFDLAASADEMQAEFERLPQRVQAQASDAVRDVRVQVDELIASVRQNYTRTVDDVDEQYREFAGDVREQVGEWVGADSAAHRYVAYLKPAGIVLSTLLLFIWLIATLSLAAGIVARKPGVHACDRSPASNRAGNGMMASVVMLFVLQFFFWIAAGLLFMVGTTTESVCAPVMSHSWFHDVLDAPDGPFDTYNVLGKAILGGDTDVFIGVGPVIDMCARDEAAWGPLHLDALVNVTELVDVAREFDIERLVADSIDLAALADDLIPADVRAELVRFAQLRLDPARKQQYFDAFDQPLLTRNLTGGGEPPSFAAALAAAADSVRGQPDASALVAKLDALVSKAEAVAAGAQADMRRALADARSSVERLDALLQSLQNATADAVAALDGFRDGLRSGRDAAVTEAILAWVADLTAHATCFADQVLEWLRTEVARCGPLATGLDAAFGGVCVTIVDEGLNSFWLAMGWLAFFNVVWIIVGVRLAKYFRVMSEEFYKYDYGGSGGGDFVVGGRTSDMYEMPERGSAGKEEVYY